MTLDGHDVESGSIAPDGFRIERDAVGEIAVPVDAYYGASTMRASLTFPTGDLPLPRVFLRTLGLIKAAAAKVNGELGLLSLDVAASIEMASREVADGKFDDQFIVDLFETGSGSATNTNANEIISRRAGELISAQVHPLDHVNLCQSANDVMPAAMRISALLLVKNNLRPALDDIERTLDAKSRDFWGVIKPGRTPLADAAPIRLGQEFGGYAGQISRARRRIDLAFDELVELPLGGTEVGTGFGCHPEFGRRVATQLSQMTGLPLREAANHFQAQSNLDSVVGAGGALRTLAIALVKTGDDIRWLASGPRVGMEELTLPRATTLRPASGSGIIESLFQSCAQVLGNDGTILNTAQGSHFEANTMLPVATFALLQSISLLAASTRNFDNQCLKGLSATGRGPELVESGLGIATGLAPTLGHDAAARIANEAAATGETVLQAATRLSDLSVEDLQLLLDPSRLVEPGLG